MCTFLTIGFRSVNMMLGSEQRRIRRSDKLMNHLVQIMSGSEQRRIRIQGQVLNTPVSTGLRPGSEQLRIRIPNMARAVALHAPFRARVMRRPRANPIWSFDSNPLFL